MHFFMCLYVFFFLKSTRKHLWNCGWFITFSEQKPSQNFVQSFLLWTLVEEILWQNTCPATIFVFILFPKTYILVFKSLSNFPKIHTTTLILYLLYQALQISWESESLTVVGSNKFLQWLQVKHILWYVLSWHLTRLDSIGSMHLMQVWLLSSCLLLS